MRQGRMIMKVVLIVAGIIVKSVRYAEQNSAELAE